MHLHGKKIYQLQEHDPNVLGVWTNVSNELFNIKWYQITNQIKII